MLTRPPGTGAIPTVGAVAEHDHPRLAGPSPATSAMCQVEPDAVGQRRIADDARRRGRRSTAARPRRRRRAPRSAPSPASARPARPAGAARERDARGRAAAGRSRRPPPRARAAPGRARTGRTRRPAAPPASAPYVSRNAVPRGDSTRIAGIGRATRAIASSSRPARRSSRTAAGDANTPPARQCHAGARSTTSTSCPARARSRPSPRPPARRRPQHVDAPLAHRPSGSGACRHRGPGSDRGDRDRCPNGPGPPIGRRSAPQQRPQLHRSCRRAARTSGRRGACTGCASSREHEQARAEPVRGARGRGR